MELSDIRVNIDRVDEEIQKLFLERMALAEQVVSKKAETADKIFKPDREKDIIVRNSQDMKPELVHEYQALIKRIMEVSRKYQYGRMLELRECFPFTYKTTGKKITSLTGLGSEEYVKDFFQVEDYVGARSYEDMAQKITKGICQAGVTVMETVGNGVNQEFHQFLAENHFYINDCVVTKERIAKKCVTFSDTLRVLEDHNRFKIMFTTRNDFGALSSILSMISDYQVNITEIHSCPVIMAHGWDYEFFLELEGNIDTKEMHSLIFQLSEETHSFQLLGSYHCEGDFE